MKFEFVKHSLIGNQNIDNIAILKSQHWNYPIESQKKWIEENIEEEDIHLLLTNNDNQLIAYLSLVEIEVTHQGGKDLMLGVGSVCVDKNYLGQHLGLLLMNLVDYYLKRNKKEGILLCSDKLVLFYEKSGWELFEGEVKSQGEPFLSRTLFSKKRDWDKIEINKLF